MSLKKWTETRDLFQKSNARGFLVLIMTWGLMGAVITTGLLYPNGYLYPIFFIVISYLQFNLFEGLLHSASHYTLFRWRRLNSTCAPLIAWAGIASLNSYREHHLDHHKNVGTKKDNIQKLYYEYYRLPQHKSLTKKEVLKVWYLPPLLLQPTWTYIKDTILDLKDTEQALISLSWGSILAVSLYWWSFGWPVIIYWIIPLLFGFPIILYWNELEDHFNTKNGHTRSNTSQFYNWLFLNEGYHEIHHNFPQIPWFRLPEAHKKLAHTLQGDEVKGSIETFKSLYSTAKACSLLPSNYFE